MSASGPREQRDFLLLWGGQTVSEVGSQVTVMVMPLVALVALHCSTIEAAMLTACQYVAYLLMALPAGVLAERLAKRRLMVGCDMARVVLVGSVPLAHACGLLTLGQLYLVALTAGMLSVVFSVAYQSYLPILISRDRLMEGNGRLSSSRSFAEFAGPGLGAALVGILGAADAMLADAVSYLVSAATLAAIRKPEPPPARDRAAWHAQIHEGLAYLWRDPIMRAGARCCAVANFFVAMAEALIPIFLVRTLGLRPGYAGVLLAAAAIGGVIAGVMAGRLGLRYGSARITWMSMSVFALPALLIPLTAPGARVVLFAVGWGAWTFAATVCGVGLVTYRQSTCPPALLPQVNGAARWISWGPLPLGAVAGGVLGTLVGSRYALWTAVVGNCAAGTLLYFSPIRTQRDMPTSAPVPAAVT